MKIGELLFESTRFLEVSDPICQNQIDVRESVGA